MTDVAIDARVTRRMSVGVCTYLGELLTRLPRVAPDLFITPVGSGENFGLAEQCGLPLAISRSGARLVHYPTMFAPLVRTRPYVLTIHDLIHLRYPNLFGRPTAWHYRFVGAALARGATRVIVGDSRTVVDCERYLQISPERCRVVPLGYDPALLEATIVPNSPRRFLFYAGNQKPHKNLATLYAAWSQVAVREPIDLRITGASDAVAMARYGSLVGRLVFTGHLSAADLREHYRTALAYVHPAFIEGFGIPMLEAAVVGTPVLASAGAVPAIVAPVAATFAPADVNGLSRLISEIVRDVTPFAARAAEGATALRAYTWDRFAAATAGVYREVIACA